jgi:hypothetical protein
MEQDLELAGFRLVNWTQHWRRIGSAWYRDAVAVSLTDGGLYTVPVLDEL